MNNNGALVISLDFELLWGVFDKVNWKKKEQYFLNTRAVIPEILKLFENYEIACTWATAGMLFNHNWDEWNRNIPEILPEYENERLSAYSFGNTIQMKQTEELCFAPGIIEQIQNTPYQEVGTHTYSHYYCLEPGQNIKSFRADLIKSKEVAEKSGIELSSLVFPRNQYNSAYLEICSKLGITAIRSNPENWYWKNPQENSLQQKIFRTADAYFGAKDKSYKVSQLKEIAPELRAQKASRLLRPFSRNHFLNKTKLNRIKNEMTLAATNNEIYHLWWHPHNFGQDPQNNLRDLLLLLNHYKKCKDQFNFRSLTMRELTNIPKKKKYG